MFSKQITVSALALTIGIAGTASAANTGGPVLDRSGAVYAQVAIYDVLPGQSTEFEKALLASAESSRKQARSLINDRILRNIDNVTLQYASYTKFGDKREAEEAANLRTAALGRYLRRPPEVHLVQLDRAYVPSGVQTEPSGKEFGTGAVGQIAHLGLFLPSRKDTRNYYESLYAVKMHTVARQPKGYMGDDLLTEPSGGKPERQAPYTPRPREATQLSVNYGEYQTLEDAEDSYVDRAQDDSPEMVALERVFFSSLQVPNRFYIFKVIGNY